MRMVAALTIVIAVGMAGGPAAPGVTVPNGGDLQAALNAARPGETIQLAPGATYVGNFILPAKNSDDTRPITVQTSDDGTLPGEGERIAPATADHLAKVRSPNGTPALQAAAGARGWRIALVEFLANQDPASDIIALGDGTRAQNALAQVPSDLVLDRLYI